MRRILLTAVIALMPLTAIAQDFNKGGAAYEAGDYATALKEWRPLAEQGHALAQNNLGIMYYNGLGVPQDDAKAVQWFRLAAEQGYADAQHSLGQAYLTGRGLPRGNNVTSQMWFIIAAENGHEQSRILLQKFAHWPSVVTPKAERRAKVCMKSNYKDCD